MNANFRNPKLNSCIAHQNPKPKELAARNQTLLVLDGGPVITVVGREANPPEDDPRFFFTKNDGFDRLFIAACKTSIDDPSNRPIAVHLAGAPVGMKDLDMGYLPKEWHYFAEAHPDIVPISHRSVHEMTVTGNAADENYFNIALPDNTRQHSYRRDGSKLSTTHQSSVWESLLLFSTAPGH
ncbi:unnamed protein product [Clonostachys solani]|uniref:Uncharacterized protein n=1 Tax=Clonostachys solani TaxID=160281 RepID=A0A9P0EBA9_9HYPO|nr:unnamed protein product [Clonostachys solani]